jgi:hypothetical protein
VVEQGQAFFDVGRDKRHFYVDTPSGEVLVFGTAFLVDVRPNATTVAVVEGDVLVSTSEGQSALSAGRQSVLRRGQMPTPPRKVTNTAMFAWLDSITPDPSVLAYFRNSVAPNDEVVDALPAESVMAVYNVGGRDVVGIELAWEADGVGEGHCDYFLHVTDSDDNLLFLDTIPGRRFDNADTPTLTVPLVDQPISGVNILHIRLIPDHTSGTVEITLTRAAAQVSNEAALPSGG